MAALPPPSGQAQGGHTSPLQAQAIERTDVCAQTLSWANEDGLAQTPSPAWPHNPTWCAMWPACEQTPVWLPTILEEGEQEPSMRDPDVTVDSTVVVRGDLGFGKTGACAERRSAERSAPDGEQPSAFPDDVLLQSRLPAVSPTSPVGASAPAPAAWIVPTAVIRTVSWVCGCGLAQCIELDVPMFEAVGAAMRGGAAGGTVFCGLPATGEWQMLGPSRECACACTHTLVWGGRQSIIDWLRTVGVPEGSRHTFVPTVTSAEPARLVWFFRHDPQGELRIEESMQCPNFWVLASSFCHIGNSSVVRVPVRPGAHPAWQRQVVNNYLLGVDLGSTLPVERWLPLRLDDVSDEGGHIAQIASTLLPTAEVGAPAARPRIVTTYAGHREAVAPFVAAAPGAPTAPFVAAAPGAPSPPSSPRCWRSALALLEHLTDVGPPLDTRFATFGEAFPPRFFTLCNAYPGRGLEWTLEHPGRR